MATNRNRSKIGTSSFAAMANTRQLNANHDISALNTVSLATSVSTSY